MILRYGVLCDYFALLHGGKPAIVGVFDSFMRQRPNGWTPIPLPPCHVVVALTLGPEDPERFPVTFRLIDDDARTIGEWTVDTKRTATVELGIPRQCLVHLEVLQIAVPAFGDYSWMLYANGARVGELAMYVRPFADQIIHGTYWDGGKGCAVGCTIHGDDHLAYESELGIPAALAFLEDRIFEAQENGEALTWPERFLSAIPVGADLSGVVPAFMSWLMLDETYGTANYTTDPEIADLAAEVGLRLAAGDIEGPEAEELAQRLRATMAAMAAWDAWATWDARDAFVNASAALLLELLENAPQPER